MKFSKVETLIIAVFFLCVGLWGISKCSSKRTQTARAERADMEEEDRPRKPDTVFVPSPQPEARQQPQAQPETYSAPPAPRSGLPKLENQPSTADAPPAERPKLTNAPPPAAAETAGAAQKYPTLYVTIDGLNMRKAPNKKSALVARLHLYEPVFFLNKKSEKQEEINLGMEKVTDYWVNIQTKSGLEGWVFGAGVHYYKTKRKGVAE